MKQKIRSQRYTIYSEKKNAIWGDPFKDRYLAQKELDEQLSKLSQEQREKSDWKIRVDWLWIKDSKKRPCAKKQEVVKSDDVLQDILLKW